MKNIIKNDDIFCNIIAGLYIILVIIIWILYLVIKNFSNNTERSYIYPEVTPIVTNPVEVVARKKQEEEIRLESYIEEMNNLGDTNETVDWYKKYKYINRRYEDVGVPDTIYNYFNDDEIKYLQKMVETECHGAGFISKVHVAEIALNRVASDKFPNSIKEVIVSPGQFVYGRDHITEETVLACEYAFQIGSELSKANALFFHSGEPQDTFNNSVFVLRDECGHNFYKIK